MEPSEISEVSEKARESNQKAIGLTMAIVAVLLAIATMLGHRTHTEEVLIQTKANDQWAYYQAKNIRSHMYEALAKIAQLSPNGKETADDLRKSSKDQRESSEDIEAKAEELEKESDAASLRAAKFDTAEIFLEVAIVLCSITLLTGKRGYWLFSFVSTAAGVLYVVMAFVMR